jgi:hypothetical protein
MFPHGYNLENNSFVGKFYLFRKNVRIDSSYLGMTK